MSPQPGDESLRLLVTVRGRVQGVFFRDSTRRKALAHGVSGWVRNLPDGNVQAALEGHREAVLAVLSFCEVGPPRAFVAGTDVAEEDPVGETGFRVL